MALLREEGLKANFVTSYQNPAFFFEDWIRFFLTDESSSDCLRGSDPDPQP